MTGKAELVKLCSISQVLAACACNTDGTTTQVKEVVIIDAKQKVIPHGSEDYPSANNSPDGSGFIRSYFTDLEGNVIPTPADWKYGGCGECEEPPNELTTVCLENVTTGEVIPGLADFTTCDGTTDEPATLTPIDFSDFGNSAQSFTIGGNPVNLDYVVGLPGGSQNPNGFSNGTFGFVTDFATNPDDTLDFTTGVTTLAITTDAPIIYEITKGTGWGANHEPGDTQPNSLGDRFLMSAPGGFIIDDPNSCLDVVIVDPNTIDVGFTATECVFTIYNATPTTSLTVAHDGNTRGRLNFQISESDLSDCVSLFDSQGQPLDSADYNIVANCDQFNTELIGPLCVRDTNGGIVATVNQINIFDNANPPVLQSSTLFDVTTGAAYTLGADETLGNCSTDPVLVKDGCLCDVVAGTYQSVYQILIPDGNGSYDFANAGYVLQSDGSSVTPTTDAVFKIGECPSGGMCETC